MQALLCETPTLYTIDIGSGNAEYALQIPKIVKKLRIQMRDSTDFRLAFAIGKVAGSTDPFLTVKGGLPLELNNLYWNKPTLFVACGSGSKKVEVLAWE